MPRSLYEFIHKERHDCESLIISGFKQGRFSRMLKAIQSYSECGSVYD